MCLGHVFGWDKLLLFYTDCQCLCDCSWIGVVFSWNSYANFPGLLNQPLLPVGAVDMLPIWRQLSKQGATPRLTVCLVSRSEHLDLFKIPWAMTKVIYAVIFWHRILCVNHVSAPVSFSFRDYSIFDDGHHFQPNSKEMAEHCLHFTPSQMPESPDSTCENFRKLVNLLILLVTYKKVLPCPLIFCELCLVLDKYTV